MRYLSIIILALLANIAQAQQVNPVTDYTFANRMSTGRSTVTDTAAYFSIGPRYGAVRGMMPPMVTDTVAMSANKRNGLLIFSIQKNKYQVWDSAGAKWADITGAAGSAIISADTTAMLLPYLRKADTTTMLLPYLRKADTVWLSNRINLKVNIADTSSMLNPYLRGSGTANYFPKFDASRSVINSKLYESGTNLLFNTTNPSFTSSGITTIENNATSSAVYTYKIADTIRAYMGYGGASTFDINNLRSGDIRFYTSATLRGRFQTDGTFRLNSLTGTGTRSVVADANGVLSAGSSPTDLIDTTYISTRAWRQKGIDSVSANVALKVNISDTSTMLGNYIRHAGNGLTKSGQALSVDTAAMATRARVQKGIDSVATLATAGVTSVATGYGLSGGTITTTGTISADSAIVASRLRVGKVVDSLALVKQNVLTNPVTGTGTTNYVPKFTGTSTVGNSQIFDNGTNVGIGTTTPTSILHIQSATPTLTIRNTIDASATQDSANNKTAGLLTFGANGAFNVGASIEGKYAANANFGRNVDMAFSTRNSTSLSEKMRLTSDGELLLGSISDLGAYIFQASGQIYNTTSAFFAQSSGRVAIGGLTSDRKLQLNVTQPATSDDGIRITDGTVVSQFGLTGTSYSYRGIAPSSTFIQSNKNLSFLADANGIFTWHTINDEMMRLNTSAELLINTTTDVGAYVIQANGPIYNTNNAVLAATTGEVYVATTTDAGNYKLQVSGNAYVTGTTVLAAGSGNVGINNTSPSERLDIVGRARFVSTNTIYINPNYSTGVAAVQVTNNAGLVLVTNNNERMRVHSDGGMKFVGQSAAPTAEAGTVYYDTDDNKLKVYNGTTWVDLH